MAADTTKYSIGELRWAVVPEPEYDPTPMVLERGHPMPRWFRNAVIRGDFELIPKPEIGERDWARPIRSVRTGHVFPMGSTVMKGDIYAKPI